MVLDCVPALAASVRGGVQAQALHVHWQFLGALPVQDREIGVLGGQPLHVLVWLPNAPHVFGEQVLQGPHSQHGIVPVFRRLVEQSPMLQPELQVLV